MEPFGFSVILPSASARFPSRMECLRRYTGGNVFSTANRSTTNDNQRDCSIRRRRNIDKTSITSNCQWLSSIDGSALLNALNYKPL